MGSSHIYSAFDDELKFLMRRISEMGGLAEQMVAESVRSLVNSDAALAQKVISDDVVNGKSRPLYIYSDRQEEKANASA